MALGEIVLGDTTYSAKLLPVLPNTASPALNAVTFAPDRLDPARHVDAPNRRFGRRRPPMSRSRYGVPVV